MMLTLFNPFPVLTTPRLILRQVEKSDAAEVFTLRSDERVLKYLDRAPQQSAEEAYRFIESITEFQNNNDSIMWAITLKGSPKLIGTICFWHLEKEHYRAEIGYMLLADYHAKGIMHEAMQAVNSYGFNYMKLHSIAANVNPNNTASIKLLERNGFVKEGYFKENYYYNGKFVDSAIYSLLAPSV